jgi:CheY-like chemotaxis protein
MITGKILLIDDDDDDQLIFKDALKEIHFNCDCLFANDGLEALAILAKRTGKSRDHISGFKYAADEWS